MTEIVESQSVRKRRLLSYVSWAALALYTTILLVLTHIPKPPPVFQKQSDKTLHLLAYLALGALLYIAASLQWPKRNMVLWTVLAGVVFAAVDETTQPLFGRAADLLDWRMDAIGVIVSVCALSLMRQVLSVIMKPRNLSRASERA